MTRSDAELDLIFSGGLQSLVRWLNRGAGKAPPASKYYRTLAAGGTKPTVLHSEQNKTSPQIVGQGKMQRDQT